MNIKPEAFYTKRNLDGEAIIPFETEVVGTAIRFDSRTREVIVDLGYGWYGTIPEYQVSVYDFTYSKYGNGNVPHQITSIIGKQICAIVIEVGEKNLKLSRKRSMIKAWYKLKNDEVVEATITGIIRCGIFLDIGNGIISFNPRQACSAVLISDSNLWYKIGDRIVVKIIDKGDKVNSKVISSNKLAFPEIDENIKPGDVITVKIGMQKVLGGFFCQVTPRIPGIIDADIDLHEGQIVTGFVKKNTKRGVRLKFIG